MGKPVLIEIIMNNQCNKRCEYCDLDFRTKTFSDQQLDTIIHFIQESSESIEYFHINFFGGEPLISFERIEYFVEHVQIPNIRYSLGTNGLLITSRITTFLQKHNFEVYLSVDNIDGISALEKIHYHEIINQVQVNCIHDPDFLHNSEKTIDTVVQRGFTRVNFMPVFTTKQWSKQSLVSLGKLKKYSEKFTNISWSYFGYFNGFPIESQFIIDTNMVIYKDLDSLIWLQKQYSSLPQDLKECLESESSLGTVGTGDITIQDLVKHYDKREILHLILSIPKVLGRQKENLLIDKILKGE